MKVWGGKEKGAEAACLGVTKIATTLGLESFLKHEPPHKRLCS